MDGFDELLEAERKYAERYVKFRIASKADADDVLQEVCLTAFQKFSQLKNKEFFKAWLISIAKNKCNDYFRMKARQLEIPIGELTIGTFSLSRCGISAVSTVRETLNLLGDKDKQILYLYFWKELPQTEIAKILNIPIGTVKSRLHTAKNNFKEMYPYSPTPKGVNEMKKLPAILPEYTIKKSDEEPFSVKWEEYWGLFIVPKLDEKVQWGSYDAPAHTLGESGALEVTSRAEIHGVPGVEIHETRKEESGESRMFRYIVQLTDTHCRMLAEEYERDGIRKTLTFLDGDDFLEEWGYGDNNCGKETNIVPKGIFQVSEDGIHAENTNQLFDIVGRYTVQINGTVYDTVRLVCLESYRKEYVMTEHYLDQNGRTILWRRFNRDDWAIDRYKKKWSEQLPNNERVTVNGETYVHWYDCITDYIL